MSDQKSREQPSAGNGETHEQDSPEPIPKETSASSVDDIVQPLGPEQLKEVEGFNIPSNKS
jgi:hypothetical protein